MARWLERQSEVRRRFDREMLDRSYAELATSIMDPRDAPSFHADDLELADGAARICLRYLRVDAGDVPDSATDLETRIEWLCRPSGTMWREIKLRDTWYKEAVGPLIARFDTGDPVAIIPGSFGNYYYHDPITGRKRRVSAKIASHIQEDATMFYRPLPQERLDMLTLTAYAFHVFDRYDYVRVLLAAVAASLVGLLPAYANQIVFNTVVPAGQLNLVLPVAGMLLGVAVSNVLIGIFRDVVMQRAATKLGIFAEAAFFSRVLMLPTSFFKQYESGELAQRVSQVGVVVELATSTVLGSGLTLVLSGIYLIQIWSYAPTLVMPALLTVLAEVAMTVMALMVSQRRQRVVQREQAKTSGLVTSLLNGIQKIKLAGAEDRAFARWSNSYARYSYAAYRQPLIEIALPAFVTLASGLGTVFIYYSAGVSDVTVANYVSFNVAFGQLTAAIMEVATIASQVAMIAPMRETLQPVLDAVPETGEGKPSAGRLSGGISVSDVSFRYDEHSPYVLEGLSFTIRPGEYVGIVGKSGCGKSTIMRLLLGFETPERGSIAYGPYDVSEVNLQSLRRSIGTVLQDGKLFVGDVFSNITVAAPGATLDDAWEAAELAGIADDINDMPMGMQTILSEGSGGISGGQRQRIMIARAICGKKRILLFDEATSALDNKTQKHVSESLDQLKCTRLVVAHRLSTIRHCDRILVLDGGCIAEEGSYDELLERGGIFAELVQRQRID